MNAPVRFLDGRVTLHAGDCLEVMAGMADNSVDAVVTDPPYHLTSIVKRFGGDSAPRTEATVGKHAYGRHAAGFMGKAWDGGDIAFRPETWAHVLRVLKPGGYLLAFASTRGYGRMSVAIEAAGFISHPLIAFLMEHDDAAEFLETLSKPQLDALLRLMAHKDLGGMLGWIFGSGFPKATRLTACTLDGPFAGIDTGGWRYGGQALKPAIEPIFMGQKPFSEDTGTANVLAWGTGAVNVAGCRVGEKMEVGRWPANVVHDGSGDVLAAFPDAPGALREVNDSFRPKQGTAVYGDYGPRPTVKPREDSGSAARFFYSAKADADDRIGAKHPTVKPVDLKRWMARLVTPPGGVVLDPFAGTGTTGEAAWREGFSAILIEREEEYRADIAERMRLILAGPTEKRHAIVKRKGTVETEAGPLFSLSTSEEGAPR